MSGITVSQAGDLLVAVKRAADPDHRARLRHEADLLARLDHPGVVRLVDFSEGPPASLRTAFVGPDSWRTAEVSTAGFAALTATVADLHDAGLAHGDLRADHVLVDAEQRPILCGFATAGPATAERIQADRAALAAMLREQAGRGDSNAGSRLRDAARALDEPALPTRVAIRLLDDLPAPAPGSPRRRPSTQKLTLGVGAAVILLAVTALLAAFGGGDEPSTDGAEAELAEPFVGVAPPPPAPMATPSEAVPDHAPPIDAGPALIVEHGGRRYGVGAPGDLVHVADWTCSGVPTPAVLRPDTGTVAVFATWPEPGGQLRPSVETVIEGAIEFTIDDEPCPELRIRTPRGSRLIEVST